MAETKRKQPARKKAAEAAPAPEERIEAAPAPEERIEAAPAPANRRHVRVRMFRQGLGDSFLLTFFGEGGARRFDLMIDLGVLLGTEDGDAKTTAVARAVAAETGARGGVDVLVATHEHWDHVSGFVQAKPVFESGELKAREVWLAWTEDRQHPLASELREGRERKVKNLRQAAKKMAAMGPAFGERARGIEEILGFFGALGADADDLAMSGSLAARAGASTSDAMKYLAEGLEGAKVVFRRPGEPVFTLPGTDVRVYVLGPPEDRTLIKKSDPTKRGREVYDDQHFALSLADSFFAALGAAPGGGAPGVDPEIADLAFPFDRKYRLDEKAAKAYRAPVEGPEAPAFFGEHYGFEGGGEESGPAWRRIGDEWLGVAADLALALDGDTNNTSLALAFELGEDGPVLLFPADAQVGNWLSWDNVSWPRDSKRPEDGAVTAADLLRRTVLYKVGHHGSHNATLREKGLERMESPDLVALIPVDQEMAERKKWSMPFGPLYERLKQKTRGRVLRVDEGRLDETEAGRYGLTAAEYKAFKERTPEAPANQRIGARPLWIDVEIDY